MNKVLIPVLALAAAGTATFGLIQMNAAGDLAKERDDLKNTLAQRSSELEAAQKDRKKAETELQTESERLAALRLDLENSKKKAKELAEAAEKNAGLANAPAPAAGGGDGAADVQRFRDQIKTAMDRFNTPEMRTNIKSGMKDGIARGYGALFTKMGLSEDNAQLASELLSDRAMAMMDKGRKLMEEGGSPEAVQKDLAATKAEYDAKLKGMLGEEKFNELNTHEQTLPDQRALDRIARNFESKNATLQPEQRTALADIMREERMKLPASNNVMDFGGGGPGGNILMPVSDADAAAADQREKQYQEQVMKRASNQANLSPDQVNLLQENFNRQNQQRTEARTWGSAIRGFLPGARPRQ